MTESRGTSFFAVLVGGAAGAIAVLSGIKGLMVAVAGVLVGLIGLMGPQLYVGLHFSGLPRLIEYAAGAYNSVPGFSVSTAFFVALYILRERIAGRFWRGATFYSQILLASWMAIGITYTSRPDYGMQKAENFIVNNLLPVVCVLAFSHSRTHIRWLITSFFLGSIVFSVGMAFVPVGQESLSGEGRLWAFYLDPIAAGRNAALVALLMLWLTFVCPSRASAQRLLGGAGAICALYLAIRSGTRGAVFALASGVITMALVLAWRKRSLAGVGLVFSVAIAAASLYLYAPFQYTIRFRQAIEDPAGGTFGQRIELFRAGWRQFVDSPIIGHGTGSLAGRLPLGAQYPHNMFIEMLAENGVVGLLLLLWFLVVAFRSGLTAVSAGRVTGSASDTAVALLILSCTAFWFAASQTSYDIAHNGLLWFFGGLAVAWELSGHKTPHIRNQQAASLKPTDAELNVCVRR